MKQILFLLVIAAMVVSCSSKDEEQKTSAKFVKTEMIAKGVNQSVQTFNGRIEEKDDVMVSFRVGGPLDKLLVEEGDFVQKGQLLARIDKRDYLIQFRQAKAQYEQIKGEYARYKELYGKGKIPANSYEKIKSGYELAEVAVDHAGNQLADTELRAPISGYISKRFVSNFETTGPGAPIVSIIDISSFELVIKVPASQLKMLKSCEQTIANIPSVGIQNAAVSLKSVNHKPDADDLYQARFDMTSTLKQKIKSGMVAELSLYAFVEEGSKYTIPSTAVFHKANKNFVWEIDNKAGTVKAREVKLGRFASSGRVEILKGIGKGDQIVVAGVQKLHEGQKVNIIKKPSKTNIGGLL